MREGDKAGAGVVTCNPMTLRVLIADDEPLARERLRTLLQAEPGIDIVGECLSGPQTLLAIRKECPDLVFLDVQMPELDGFQVLQALSTDRLPVIVFVTAHHRFALAAFETRAVDYLLKPFDSERFKKALRRARETLRKGRAPDAVEEALRLFPTLNATPKQVDRFAVRSGGRILLVNTSEIEWIRGADNYSELHVGKSVHLLRRTIAALQQQLPVHQFLRISRSLVVNVAFIKEIHPKSHGDCFVVLRNGTELPASRNYRDELSKLLNGPF